MREQIANRDVALAALELRNVVGDLVVQAELALLEELHQRRRGSDYLGQRREVEDGVDSHRLGSGNQRTLAVSFAMYDLAVMADQKHRARKPALLDRQVDGVVQCLGAAESLGG